MGEHKRREAREAAARERAEQERISSGRLSFAEIDRLMGEDPDDRAVREAHGFTYEDDFEDRSLLCRNGCGLSYYDIAVGKVRECAARQAVTAVREALAELDGSAKACIRLITGLSSAEIDDLGGLP